MPMSPFLADLRSRVGNALLMLPAATGCVFDDEGRLLVARHAGRRGCGRRQAAASTPTSVPSTRWCVSCTRSSASTSRYAA
ncbi:NUDIX hydrolase [Nonomuraea recticatena]|uniref:hypothetical protein n=1 Tax=Nonomuraea recticatena TaxID=46178 RepID=UPI00361BBF12